MARVLSAIVLIPIVVGAVWFFPLWGTLTLTLVAGQLAVVEYVAIATALGFAISRRLSAVGVALASLAILYEALPPISLPNDFIETRDLHFYIPASPFYVALFIVLVMLAARALISGAPRPQVLGDLAASIFPVIYIGLPLGTLAATGVYWLYAGRKALLLLMAVIVVSDSAQYYTGRAFGRRPLAPSISPKKTVEGAVGGLVFGTLAMMIGGRLVFSSPLWALAIAGGTITVLGMMGDLFESLLKRSANVKDSSALIPGHGGILDRIDSWLFAAPAYYLFTQWFTLLGTSVIVRP